MVNALRLKSRCSDSKENPGTVLHPDCIFRNSSVTAADCNKQMVDKIYPCEIAAVRIWPRFRRCRCRAQFTPQLRLRLSPDL